MARSNHTKAEYDRRRAWLSQKTGLPLVDEVDSDPETYRGLVENHVGFMSIPLSFTGPLTIHGQNAQGVFYVPLCVLEGTLALSMTRGALISTRAGGIETIHYKQEIARSPAFSFSELNAIPAFIGWVEKRFAEFERVVGTTTRHGKLVRVDPIVQANHVVLDIVLNTADAAGQNMVTFATDAICRFIEQQYHDSRLTGYLIESNFSGDKTPCLRNQFKSRGHAVVARTRLPKRLIKRYLNTEPSKMVQGWEVAQQFSEAAGLLQANLHVANALSSLYLALGQDPACVVENAIGRTHFSLCDDDVVASLTLPSLTVGTVGGATRLTQARRHLEMIDCYGPGKSAKLAEIIAAAALALEISLGGAITSNEFALAHQKYGR